MDAVFVSQIAVGVFFGNAMTLSAYFALKRFMTVYDDKDAPWWAIIAFLFPVGIAILTLIAGLPAVPR